MTAQGQPKTIEFGDYVFTPENRLLRHANGTSRTVGRTPAVLIEHLSAADGVAGKEGIYQLICDRSEQSENPEPKIVDVQIRKLRLILEELSAGGGGHIETLWGRGYRLVNEPVFLKDSLRSARGERNKGLGRRLASIHAVV